MTLTTIVVLVALVLGVLNLFRSKGTSELAWAVTLLALAELWPLGVR